MGAIVNDWSERRTAMAVAELSRMLRRRWNRVLLASDIVGFSVAVLAFVVFRDDLRWALVAFYLALWFPIAGNAAVGVLLRRDRRALRVLSWYMMEVETDVDRMLDAGDAAGARSLALARRPPASGWERFQDARLHSRLAEAGAPVYGTPVDLPACVATLDAEAGRAASAALVVLGAQRLGAPWLGHLAGAGPDLSGLLALRRTRRRRLARAMLVGVTALALVAAALMWPPPLPRLL
jgi:hypothetical protein